ncbi:MAG: lysophospholipase [Actinomycetota bacterium]|nr:lysophospholipase [Actinomycetota bacterium]
MGHDAKELSGPEGAMMTLGRVERFVRRWPGGEGAGAAPFVIVHGFGEHSGRYDWLARQLAATGRDVWSMDLAGHGRSPGSGTDVGGIDGVLDDIAALIACAARSSGATGAPVLYGHSMGGVLAAAFAATRDTALDALVLSAPAVHLALQPGLRGAALRIVAPVLPRLGIGRIDPGLLSRDAEAVAAFVADPLVWHGPVPAGTAWVMVQAGRQALARARHVTAPVLIVHGTDDRIVPVAASRALAARLDAAEVRIVELPDVPHEPHHDPARDQEVAVLTEWLARR